MRKENHLHSCPSCGDNRKELEKDMKRKVRRYEIENSLNKKERKTTTPKKKTKKKNTKEKMKEM